MLSTQTLRSGLWGHPIVFPLYFLIPRPGSPAPSPSTGAPAGLALPTAQLGSMPSSLGACSSTAPFVQPPQAHTNHYSPLPHTGHTQNPVGLPDSESLSDETPRGRELAG